MQYLLLGLIRLYWLIMPKAWRRECIFRVSCSYHVYGITQREGLLAGLSAFKYRWKTCRPGYRVECWDGNMMVHLADGSVVTPEYIAEGILSQYEAAFKEVETRIMTVNHVN